MKVSRVMRMKSFRLLLISLLVPFSGDATTGAVAGGYHIDSGQNATITAHSVTKKVTNNHASGLTIYVPLNTSTEWAAYVASPPPGVTVTNPPPSCPTNYVSVSALAGYTTADFCVAKYEMKNVSGVATSQATGTPWVSIQRGSGPTTGSSAWKECRDLGTGYDLISNAQWQTIARDIAGVAVNWSSGTVGTGQLNQGHVDGTPASTLAANASDASACSGTGQTCSNTVWSSQRRTHVLSGGNVLWDFGGNAWEWTKDDYSSLGVSPAVSGAWFEYTHASIGATNRALFSAADSGWSSTQGIGQIMGGNLGGVLRGGGWGNSVRGGVFSANLLSRTNETYTDTDVNIEIGFRCVYAP